MSENHSKAHRLSPALPALGEPSAQVDGSLRFTTRPVITGRLGVVAAGHYLATSAGMDILRRGGNAIDAAVMCLSRTWSGLAASPRF